MNAILKSNVAALVVAVALLFGATGCATTSQAAGSVQKGKASYYYGKWHGKKTANGEIYDQNTMTAAHKSLPFGTKVKVTNMNNGKSVVVRINNRGPYVSGRIIDLSLAAAKQLNMTKAGVVPVTVQVL